MDSAFRFLGVFANQRLQNVGFEWNIPMQLTLAHIGGRFASNDETDQLTRLYLDRCQAYARCQTQPFRSEEAFLDWLARQSGRTPVFPVLLDSRGRSMDSAAFAAWLGRQRDSDVQHMVFAIGPASGWSDGARKQGRLLFSLGPMTLAHGLARAVLTEQLYRAFTILAGHPYHTGH